MNYFKKAFLPLFVIIFTFLSLNICAQEKEKSGLNKRLSEIKGKVDKVTVQVDGKDVVFEGKEAEKLVKRMKTSNANRALSYSIGKNFKIPHVAITTNDDLEEIEEAEGLDHNIVLSFTGGDDLDNGMKTIKLEKKEGKTKLTVTTEDENGKEVTKEYEGEEADKYLEENNIGVFKNFKGKKWNISGFGSGVGRLYINKSHSPHKIYIEKSGGDDEDSDVEITIQKGDKTIKAESAKKAKVKKETKED